MPSVPVATAAERIFPDLAKAFGVIVETFFLPIAPIPAKFPSHFSTLRKTSPCCSSCSFTLFHPKHFVNLLCKFSFFRWFN
jgi:hypothetical protein